jgi:Mycoplasma protein of unknown function, DUF285
MFQFNGSPRLTLIVKGHFNNHIAVLSLTWNVGHKRYTNENDFDSATTFDSDISLWKTGQVTNVKGMLNTANAFNTVISSWNVSIVTNRNWIFQRLLHLTAILEEGMSRMWQA